MIDLPRLGAPEERRHRGEMLPRYEDVAQDGRLKLGAIPSALGGLWRAMLATSEAAEALRAEGIVPVLRRLVIAGTDTPIGVERPIQTEGCWGTARATGERTRFLLNMRLDLRARRARAHGPPPEASAPLERLGGVYAEHVFTRPFARPDERRVERLPEGIEAGEERPYVGLEELLRVGGEAVDAELEPRGERLLGLAHTDSNQHVNSLVYPRLFEEAALEAWGEGDLLMRAIELVWRKPSFAGDRVLVSARRVREGERRGAIATVTVAGEPRPRCAARLWLG